MKTLWFLKKLFSYAKSKFNDFYNTLIFRILKIQINKNWNINGRLYISNYGQIIIGENFVANSGKNANPIGGDTSMRFVTKANGVLSFGDNVHISNSTIVSWNKIEIGNNVFIGGGCKMWDTDFHSIDPIERIHCGDKSVKTAPIKINDYAFIGGSSIILKGVTIGKKSIVAAGSVVAKSIPDNELWGGNPARFIRKIKDNE